GPIPVAPRRYAQRRRGRTRRARQAAPRPARRRAAADRCLSTRPPPAGLLPPGGTPAPAPPRRTSMRAMKFEGIHHVTAITGDAPQNVEFYAHLLGLRLVKKTVNQDDPTVYHLFYADERGSAGSDITFFEYPGLPRGEAGAGMVHRVVFRVGSEDALAFWADRLGGERSDGSLAFSDPEGLDLELRVVETDDEPLVAKHAEIPEEFAIQGFDGVRAFTFDPAQSAGFLERTLEFEPAGNGEYEIRGEKRGSWYAYDRTDRHGSQGAGTVHHVAWASPPEQHETWRERV